MNATIRRSLPLLLAADALVLLGHAALGEASILRLGASGGVAAWLAAIELAWLGVAALDLRRLEGAAGIRAFPGRGAWAALAAACFVLSLDQVTPLHERWLGEHVRAALPEIPLRLIVLPRLVALGPPAVVLALLVAALLASRLRLSRGFALPALAGAAAWAGAAALWLGVDPGEPSRSGDAAQALALAGTTLLVLAAARHGEALEGVVAAAADPPPGVRRAAVALAAASIVAAAAAAAIVSRSLRAEAAVRRAAADGLRAEQRFAEAAAAYGEALAREPRALESLRGMALAAYGLGRLEESRRWFRLALGEHPRDARLWKEHGSVAGRLGRHRAAERSYRRALEIAPADPEAWALLGVALEGTRDLAGARHAYERALALEPGQPLAASRLPAVGRAE